MMLHCTRLLAKHSTVWFHDIINNDFHSYCLFVAQTINRNFGPHVCNTGDIDEHIMKIQWSYVVQYFVNLHENMTLVPFNQRVS